MKTSQRNTIARVVLGAIVALIVPALVAAQTYTISPPPFQTAFDNSGKIINNACVWTYTAGTTTAATTYSDASGTPNSNPIRSDAAGRFTAYLTPGSAYKFVYETSCTPPSHGSTLRTADNISAMPPSSVSLDVVGTAGESMSGGAPVYLSDGTGGKIAGLWYLASATNTYSSITPVVGLATATLMTGVSGSIRILGSLSGLGPFVVGSPYYVAATAGTLTLTPPGNARIVGTADTTSSLVISNPTINGWLNQSVTSTSTPTFTSVTSPSLTGAPVGIVEGRLSLTSGVPVTITDVTGATTVYYEPYVGNRIALYDGSTRWNVRTFTEISLSIAACTASKPYDVFLYDNSGTVTAEMLVWTNTTTRATALVTQDGVLVKSGATTRRYIGSFYCNASAGQTDDSRLKRSLYNLYNRVRRPVRVFDATNTWNYTTATWRQADGSTANQIEILQGWSNTAIDLLASAEAKNATGSVDIATSIGEDSTSAPQADVIGGTMRAAGDYAAFVARLTLSPAVGRHVYTWLEYSNASGTTGWVGQQTFDSHAVNSGLSGTWED